MNLSCKSTSSTPTALKNAFVDLFWEHIFRHSHQFPCVWIGRHSWNNDPPATACRPSRSPEQLRSGGRNSCLPVTKRKPTRKIQYGLKNVHATASGCYNWIQNLAGYQVNQRPVCLLLLLYPFLKKMEKKKKAKQSKRNPAIPWYR